MGCVPLRVIDPTTTCRSTWSSRTSLLLGLTLVATRADDENAIACCPDLAYVTIVADCDDGGAHDAVGGGFSTSIRRDICNVTAALSVGVTATRNMFVNNVSVLSPQFNSPTQWQW